MTTPTSPSPPPAPEATIDLTRWLQAWRSGDGQALAAIVATYQGEFLRMAGARLRGQDDVSLSRSDVVQEALLRLMNASPQWANREHFFATVALTMRSVLCDHVRAKQAAKREGGQRVDFTLSLVSGEADMAADLLTLDRLLQRLGEVDPRAMRILDMTYFGGLQRQDIATVLDVSVPTVDRELRFARAWLVKQLERELEA